MMTNNQQVKINELVRFLSKYDKSKITQLKDEFKVYDKYLDTGVMMPLDKDIETDEYLFRLKVSKEALESIYDKSIKITDELKVKLKKLNFLQLISQLIVLISGATILSTLKNELSGVYGWIKYIAPCLVLISSILTIWAKNKSESFLTGSKNLYDTTSELITLKNEATFVKNEIIIVEKFFNLQNAKSIIETSNSIAKRMYDLIEKQ